MWRIVASLLLMSSCTVNAKSEQPRLFLVGQDLASVEAYATASCCPAHDGVTTYLSFYRLRSAENAFGGLGMNNHGEWTERTADWGAGPINAYLAAGQTPPGGVLNIGLSLAESDQAGGLALIMNGQFDAEIDKLAAFCRRVDIRVLLRIGYEFDGAWNAGYHQAGLYVQAWRRIVDAFRAAGVSNVDFVWHASASPVDDIIDGGHEDISRWYPGDDYVDWVGLSWFVLPDERPSGVALNVPTARELATEVLDFAGARAKPVIIAEAAPQGFDLSTLERASISHLWDGPSRDHVQQLSAREVWLAWYAPFFDFVSANPSVRAIAYINADWDTQDMWDAPYESGYWGDSRTEVNPQISRWFSQRLESWRNGEDLPSRPVLPKPLTR